MFYRKAILNPRNTALEEVLAGLQVQYPQAVIKKPWLGPQRIQIRVDNYQLWVIARPGKLIVDFNPPVLWILLGMFGIAIVLSLLLSSLFETPIVSVRGAVSLLIGFIIVKALFRNK